MWGATERPGLYVLSHTISIHAPRVGRDPEKRAVIIDHVDFNPRAPCGARPHEYVASRIPSPFQSTRPVWGATDTANIIGDIVRFQSTRPVWGATSVRGFAVCSTTFQSTRPVWGATPEDFDILPPVEISIHAPRVGRDFSLFCIEEREMNFNPRAPCGARRRLCCTHWSTMGFQSTRPVWGATDLFGLRTVKITISIHAPRVGRDYGEHPRWVVSRDFNPRAPCGARRV